MFINSIKRNGLIFIFSLMPLFVYTQKQVVNKELINIEEKLYFYPEEGEKMLNQLISNPKVNEAEKYQGHLNFLSGVLAYKKGESDISLNYIEKALVKFVNDENKLYQAKSQLILGWIAEKIGYWDQSKINYYKVLDLVDKKNKREQGLAYLGLARCNHYLRHKKGNELYLGSRLLSTIEKKEYHLYAEFLNLVIKPSNHATPNKLEGIAQSYINLHLYNNAASTFKAISSYYRKHKDYKSAHEFLDRALALNISEYPSATLLPSLNQMKGLTYFYQKDYISAEVYLKKSLSLCDTYNKQSSKYYAYNTLYRIDTLKGDYKSAHLHLSKSVESQNAKEQKGEKQLAKLMEISFNLLALQEENDRLRSLRNNIILLTSSVILILAIVFITIYYKQKIKNRLILDKEKEKKQALHSLLINLSEKRLLNKNYIEVENDVNNISEETVERKTTVSEDFEECYSESIKKIETQHPELTRSDASYGVMFSLNLSNDVIAEIKNINAESIRKTKLRIRNKLGLEMGYDLDNYFTHTLESVKMIPDMTIEN